MPLKFITGNKKKIAEARQVIPDLELLDIELAEIQDLDAKKILEHKLKEAFNHEKGEFLVEDTSLYYDCFGGKLPGPLIKWFLHTLGPEGLYNLAKKQGNTKAKAQTMLAYAKNKNEILYFVGTTHGRLVKPKGDYFFGFDEILVPNGRKLTVSKLKSQGQFVHSPRNKAFKKLKKYLEQH